MPEHRTHVTTWAHQKRTWYTVQCSCGYKSRRYWDKDKAERDEQRHLKTVSHG
jgi:hypothetical protein